MKICVGASANGSNGQSGSSMALAPQRSVAPSNQDAHRLDDLFQVFHAVGGGGVWGLVRNSGGSAPANLRRALGLASLSYRSVSEHGQGI